MRAGRNNVKLSPLLLTANCQLVFVLQKSQKLWNTPATGHPFSKSEGQKQAFWGRIGVFPVSDAGPWDSDKGET